MLCVFYFFYLWHSGVSSLIAGSALFLLVLLFILLLERRTLTTRDHALRVRIGGAIALEELLVLPSEQAAQSICTLLCESLGAKPLGSAKLLYDGKTYLVRCAQCLSGSNASEGDVLSAHRAKVSADAELCILASTGGFSPAALRAGEWLEPPVRLISGRQLALLFGQRHPATDEEIARRARRQRFTLYPTAYSGSCAVPRKAETLSALRSPAHGLLLDVWFVLRADFRYRFLCAGDALRQKES